MFGPDWTEGCPGCSYVTDHTNGILEHLGARDVSFVLVSRAAIDKLTAFKQRMGWTLPWVSSGGTDFNHDFDVTITKEEVGSRANANNSDSTPSSAKENPGLSLFFKDPSGAIFRTYSTYARGLDALLGTYVILDRAPKGRDEGDLAMPMNWVRHHDKYEPTLQSVESCCHNKNQS